MGVNRRRFTAPLKVAPGEIRRGLSPRGFTPGLIHLNAFSTLTTVREASREARYVGDRRVVMTPRFTVHPEI